MKRFLICTCCLLFLLCGCTVSPNRSDVSTADMYDAIETGLNIANQYLAEEISKDEAESQLTKCYTTVIGYAKAAEETKIDLLSEEGQARTTASLAEPHCFCFKPRCPTRTSKP